MTLVDSGETVAQAIAHMLAQQHLAHTADDRSKHKFLATDDTERFARVGSRFLGAAITASDVERVDL